METYRDTAFAMAAVSAAIGTLRLLIRKGLISNDEAKAALLEQADLHRDVLADKPNELNEQTLKILEAIASSIDANLG